MGKKPIELGDQTHQTHQSNQTKTFKKLYKNTVF